MSAFLGPIHYWLYKKIQIQQSMVDQILKLSDQVIPELRSELDRRYQISETRPLEEVIDQENIHGWLQNRVSQVELKLADCITSLLKAEKELLHAIENIFMNKGIEEAALIHINNAKEAFQAVNDCLLDGMPCDHANILLEQSEEEVIWRRNTCVHRDYWEQVNGDITLYYNLRDAFIRGLLTKSSLKYEKVDDITYRIVNNKEKLS